MHYRPARLMTGSSIMMLMSMLLIIGSMWIVFGLVVEPVIVQNHPDFAVILTIASIVWTTISLLIAFFFIHRVRSILKRARHEGKT